MSNRTLARTVVALALAAATVAGCTSSKSGGGPTDSAPPTLVPSSHGGPGKSIKLEKLLLRHVPGSFKQTPDAKVNTNTGFAKAAGDDPRNMKRARRTLHRDRFVGTYQRVWTGFGNSTIRIILDQFQVVGGPRSYQTALGDALMKKLGATTPVTVPGIPTATAFTQKEKTHQSTFILASAGVVMMQVRVTGKVALGQVGIAVSLAARQFKRL